MSMSTAEAHRKATKALELQEAALNLSMEVMRARYPVDARDTDAFSIAGLIYRGHEGVRRLVLRVEREIEEGRA